MYDIAIVGAGPAGATLARLIGKSYKVLLIDKRQFTSDQKKTSLTKCCGGLLAPDAQEMMAILGLELPQKVLVGPQLFVVRTIDLQHSLERYYQRFYVNLDREKFDQWLVSLVPASVSRRFGCVFKSYQKENKVFKLTLSQQGTEYVEYAKILVGADGASSVLRRQAFPNQPFPKKYIAFQEWFEIEKVVPYFSSIFDSEITDFYSWTIPKNKFLLIGAALIPGNQAALKFALLKKKLRDHGFELGKSVKREGAEILRPQTTGRVCLGQDKIALLGEAAGWISPSSAEGLSYAMKSALLLGQSLLENPNNFLKLYDQNTKNLRRNILLKNLKCPFMYYPGIRKIVMQSGVQSVEIQQY